MKIGIDVRCLLEGRRTGVEEYTRNILENLFKIDQKNRYILFFNSFKKRQTDFFWLKKFPNVDLKKFSFPNKLLNFSLWYSGFPKIDRMLGGVDIFFAPNIFFGSFEKKTKLVSVIHDLSFERYPNCFSWKRRLWHIFINSKKICRRSNAIAAVSESTKNDLVSIYGISPEKIKVISSGVASDFGVVDRNNENLIRVKEKYCLPFKFILYFGTVEPRKNITGLIRAFDRLRKTARERGDENLSKYKLVIAGERGWLSEEIFSERERAEFSADILMAGAVDDGDKVFFYNLASLFVYPSFFEGFGFPPLEAMASGVPVICSNNSSLPEVAGNAAILIDPDKPDEIFLAMKEILEKKEFRQNLIQKGLIRSQEFRWEKAAQELLALFEKIK